MTDCRIVRDRCRIGEDKLRSRTVYVCCFVEMCSSMHSLLGRYKPPLAIPSSTALADKERNWAGMVQVYEVNRKLLQEHAAPLMAVYLHGVAVVRQELNMDVGGKSIKGMTKLLCLVTLKICLSCIAAVMPHRTGKTSKGVSISGRQQRTCVVSFIRL